MSATKVVLVTGGSGLVGRAIRDVVEKDKRPGEEWIFAGSADGNLLDKRETEALFARHKPSHVVHLAAQVWLWFWFPLTV